MGKFRHAMMMAVLVLIIALILFSIYGAFRGAHDAQSFFNSPPIAGYWFILILTLAAGVAVFQKLIRFPGLLFIHLGCILVLVGAMYGSKTGHRLQNEFLGKDNIYRGQMLLGQAKESSQVILNQDGRTSQLPFSIRLNEFRIEYYKPKYLQIQTRQGQSWKIPIELNSDFDLGNKYGTIRIVKQFQNFRIQLDDNIRKAIDSNEPGYNPAIEVQIEYPNGDKTNQYVFERFSGHLRPQDKFLLAYTGTVRDYISDVAVIENGKITARKNIEVNHPLHYGGYYFYQQSYDIQDIQYSILTVVSDNGLSIVYSGYIVLGGGVFWHFWLRHLLKGTKRGN